MSGIGLHPEATDDPATIRWVIPVGTLGFVGPVSELPEGLHGFGITALTVAPTSVDITLAEPGLWRTHGPKIRTALLATLAAPEAWQAPADARKEDVLAGVVREVIAGPTGDFIRSHGGEVELSAVRGNTAVLRLGGACEHCPALGFTLHGRLESAIRRSYPTLERLEIRDSA